MKKLPKPEKNLKNFILGEDAKIIDKTITKVALSISFGILAIEGAFAGGAPSPPPPQHTNQLLSEFNDNNMGNDADTNYITTKSAPSGKVVTIDVPPKSIQTAHANHYNAPPAGGKK